MLCTFYAGGAAWEAYAAQHGARIHMLHAET